MRVLAALALSVASAHAAGAPPRPAVRVGDACTSWYDTLEASRTSNSSYRNVRWFGAKGDGVTDDTAAFVTALTANRSYLFTLETPMVVYVPPGDYVIKATLPLWFLTHLVGNSRCPPRLVVPPNTMTTPQTFVLSGDLSYDGEHDDEFYRGVQNIDIVFGTGNSGGCGVHWAVSQATFLRNMVIDMSASGQYGIFQENGSGGFASDLTILGGVTGLNVGSQQWTWININVTGSSMSCVNQLCARARGPRACGGRGRPHCLSSLSLSPPPPFRELGFRVSGPPPRQLRHRHPAVQRDRRRRPAARLVGDQRAARFPDDGQQKHFH